MPPLGKRILIAPLAAALLIAGTPAPAGATPDGYRHADTTSTVERQRVDRVATPELAWSACYEYAECAKVRLPLDYDKPGGATTELALLRVKARDQQHRIGSLFINPGGPGGSGTSIALAAPGFLSESLLDRFDIVGVDPRGIADSTNVRCWPSAEAQAGVLDDMNVAFPWGRAEEKKYVAAAERFGKACSTTGLPLTGAMSTAEVVRDMEVLRRAVGDRKLTYLGFSYGTAIGQYYANMFPERFRAIVVDGVLDPSHWVGTRQTADLEQDERLRSADGAYRALREILKRCDAAGESRCVFAAGNPVAKFETIAQRLRARPLTVTDEFGTYTVTYADFVGGVLGSLYGTDAGPAVVDLAEQLWRLLETPATAAAAKVALRQRIMKVRAAAADPEPYDNGFEAFAGVLCTDALHPRDADQWPALMAKADRRAPYFGRAWGWGSAQCARDTWTVRDEDAYAGPWNRRTAAPVLVVGSLWDPATSYDDAVSASRLLANARLLTSTNWGHTAYGSGDCATSSIDAYLLNGTLPARGTVCEGAFQPFTDVLPQGLRAATGGASRPPVATPLPPSVLNGNR